MGNHLDSLRLCLLKHRSQRLGIERNDADGVPVLGKQGFHVGRLIRSFRGAAVENVRAVLLVVLLDAVLHALEPGDVGHLRNDGDLVILRRLPGSRLSRFHD